MGKKEAMLGKKIAQAIEGLSLEFLMVLWDIVERLSGKNGKFWLEKIKQFLRDENHSSDESGLKRKWSRIYKKHFGIKTDFSELQIPKKPDGDWRLIIVAQGVTPENIFQACKKTFGAWRTNENLDKIVISDRSAKDNAYAVWVRANIEADEEFKNLSANELKKQNHIGITLEERMLLEIFYFTETGKHLDISNWTLCSGSRYSDGFVPRVFWGSGDHKMCVDWYYSGNDYSGLRSRQVVC